MRTTILAVMLVGATLAVAPTTAQISLGCWGFDHPSPFVCHEYEEGGFGDPTCEGDGFHYESHDIVMVVGPVYLLAQGSSICDHFPGYYDCRRLAAVVATGLIDDEGNNPEWVAVVAAMDDCTDEEPLQYDNCYVALAGSRFDGQTPIYDAPCPHQ